MDLIKGLAFVSTYATYLIVAYSVCLCIYRLALHPLSKYPGPLAAKISGLYGVFYAFRKDLPVQTWKDHLKYGPIVRHGPNKLVFNSRAALRDIYRNERVTKSRAYLISQRIPGICGLFNAVDTRIHQKKKKITGVPLGQRIHKAEPIMIDQINILIQQLLLTCQKSESSPVNMTSCLAYLTMDIMGHFVFSYPLNMQTDSTHRFMINNVTANLCLNVALQLPFLRHVKVTSLPLIRDLIRGNRYLEVIRKMLQSYLSQGNEAKQDLIRLFGILTTSCDEDILIKQMESEAVFLISAGSDTQTTWLSALLHYLSENRHCYQRLAQEIRSSFHNDKEIRQGPQLASCRYLRACLDETLRLTPPIAGTLWREQTFERHMATAPLMVDGHYIPPGTEIGVNIYALHHNEQYFREPFKFKPERWLEEFPDGVETMKDAFTPFSSGANACMGKIMAYHEAGLVIAKILWHLDFEKTSDSTARFEAGGYRGGSSKRGKFDEFPTRHVFGSTHDGPWLLFQPRGE